MLSVRAGDPRPGSGQAHQYVAAVTDDKGQEHRVEAAESLVRSAGGIRNLDRKRVRISGTRRHPASQAGASAAPVVEATSVEVMPGEAPPPQGLAGSQRFATILCRFGDSTATTPRDVAYVNGLLGDTYPGISRFWRENSFNQINNVGSVVKGWYNLPGPRSDYVTGSPPNFQLLANHCTAAADAELDFNDYTGINLLFNQDLDCCAWGGSQFITLDGPAKPWPMTWMPPWAYANQSVLGHEMGHAYGLPHSSGNYGAVYDSRWDVMSGGMGGNDATYGRLGTHTIGYHKDSLGWIPAARKYTLPGNACQAITLDHLSQVPATPGNYLMAQTPVSANRFYTVEARRNNGYDNGRIPGGGDRDPRRAHEPTGAGPRRRRDRRRQPERRRGDVAPRRDVLRRRQRDQRAGAGGDGQRLVGPGRQGSVPAEQRLRRRAPAVRRLGHGQRDQRRRHQGAR